MSAICHVKEHPDSATLASVEYYDTASEPQLAAGKVRRTPDEQRAWERAEIAAGWVAAPVPLTASAQAQLADDQTDATEGQALVAMWAKFQDGTITNAEQRRVLKWLFKLEMKKRGLL